MGPRLHRVLRESDTVARFGGDEFGILLTHVSGPAAAEEVARAVHRALEEPFAIQGLTLDVEASIGIALHPTHASDFEELMQRADVAMYRAKAKRSGYEVYVPSEDESDATKLKLASELRQAPLRNELVMHYQPKADLRTGRIVGAEALMRWRHPAPRRHDARPLHPAGRAERPHPLAHAVRGPDGAGPGPDVARGGDRAHGVGQPVDPRPDRRLASRRRSGRSSKRRACRAHLLELEITESVIMADPMRARGVVARLREMGVKVAIDDFGLGYSSLGYLKNLPVNDLKIDKSFVINMMEDSGDAVIVQSTIDLAHNLGLTVIAEGVESDETWRRLRTLGCDVAQGWLIGRPLPAADFATWLNRGGFMPPAARWSAA